jgi:hypothetical protein
MVCLTRRQTRKGTACPLAEREWIVAGAPIGLNPIGSEGAGPWNYSKRNLTSRAHSAKLEFSKPLQQHGLQSWRFTLHENGAPQPRIVVN